MAVHQATCEICQRLESCRAGTHPGLIIEMDTGFAVLGDSQFFLGYSLLLCKLSVTEVDELPRDVRIRHLEEMAQLAAAVRMVTSAFKVNCEALGNVVHHLHWHIFPRRQTDPAPSKPVWVQMPKEEEAAKYRLDPDVHGGLAGELKRVLERIRSAD